MMKYIYISLFILCSTATMKAQEKYSTKTGTITFEASVPSFEEVKATHSNVGAILKSSNGEFAALALVKGFRFKLALMEEHFNENYMESTAYPKAVVKGKLSNFNISELSENETEFLLKGNITMHGTTRALEEIVRVSLTGDSINLKTEFVLNPEDFNIKIPKIVANKIADEVNITANFSLSKSDL
ncbi:MAG: YceI family protein [Flavobacteriaceae bacterium]|nr:YceI family protein [Flavobacteriaceae bacterium]